jgi:DNA-binding SARP family transcriptional activator/TolB-like protein
MQYRGQDVALGNRKARALLIVLAVARGAPVRREALAAMLWERSAQKQALNSLNQALYVLRRELTDAGFAGLQANGETIALDVDQIEADFLDLEDQAKDQDADALNGAMAMYAGPLMPGFAASAPAFEQWLATERARLADIAADAGLRFMSLAEADAEIDAQGAAESLLTIDPYNEAALRVLMRQLATNGRVSRALSVFGEFEQKLESDLGVAPTQITREFRDAIGRGEFPSPAPAEVAAASVGGATGAKGLKPIQLGLGALVIALVAGALLWQWGGDGRRSVEALHPRLLILPLTAANGEDVDPAFAGLMDDLSAELSRASRMALLSRETAHAKRDWTAADAQALGATHILRGSVRIDQNAAILNLRLTETADDLEIWSHRLRAGPNLLSFRRQVLDDIAGSLRVKLVGDSGQPEFTDDAVAFEHYLTGLAAFHRATPEQHRVAIENFESALARDRGFALAQSALARSHFRTAFGAQEFADAMEVHWIEGFLALKLALADPALEGETAALALRSQLALHRRDIDGAVRTARAAIVAAPGDYLTRLTLARALIYAGDSEAAGDELKIALALNPMRPANSLFLRALAAFGAGNIAAAEELIDRVVALNEPVDPEFFALAAATKALAQDKSAADIFLQEYAQAIETRPRRLWRAVLTTSSNPRALTWGRPSLASVVARFPFRDAASVERLARGLVIAGIGGQSLGYYEATETERLRDVDIRALMFGARATGPSPFGDGASWSQIRTEDGSMFQNTPLGPVPHAQEAKSITWDDQLCDQWSHAGRDIEICGTLFKLPEVSVFPGIYLLANELGYFPFSVSDE